VNFASARSTSSLKPNSEEHLSIMSTTAASLSTSFSRIQAILNPFSLRRGLSRHPTRVTRPA
jgi:hypothetical protein